LDVPGVHIKHPERETFRHMYSVLHRHRCFLREYAFFVNMYERRFRKKLVD
jgi:hypothetical protein